MILSMTGFGRATGHVGGKEIRVTIKSLNGKSTDVRMKLPPYFQEKEILIRKLITEQGHRGKFDVNFSISSTDSSSDHKIDTNLFKNYYQQLSELNDELGLSSDGVLAAILRIPNVISQNEVALEDSEWAGIKTIVNEAVADLESFRVEEGKALEVDLVKRTKIIQDLLSQIPPFEAQRIAALKDKLARQFTDWKMQDQVDQNRFEQEIIFYLEKLDITEEKVRLAQHCKYFLEIIEKKEKAKGKKLGFVGQEMGREINTLGAKAQFADIQKIIIIMKDELEKIKEQILNVV